MTSNPTLALNGEAILLKNMRVTVSQQFQDKDQSGQTSATTKSEQGIKGKELRVSGEIPYKNPENLRRIFELGSATDASGQRQKYRVAHEAARAVNFREATFTGTRIKTRLFTLLYPCRFLWRVMIRGCFSFRPKERW